MDKQIKKMWYVYTHAHTHTVEYYSPLQRLKYEILPFTTKWINLEDIMLREKARERNTNTAWCHLYVGFKKES